MVSNVIILSIIATICSVSDCLMQACQQGPNVQVTIAQQSASVAQSVSPGGMRASFASTLSHRPTFSHVNIQRGHSHVTQASCVRGDSVLKLTNTILTNGTKQIPANNNIRSKIYRF